MRVIRFTALVSVAILAGCGVTSKKSDSESTTVSQAPNEYNVPAEVSEPFELRVLDEFNDGNTLYVLGSVTPKVPWPADDMVVRLTALKGGEVINVANYPLQRADQTQAAAQKLPPGKEVVFSLSLPSAQMTDYQLELVWGEEKKLGRGQPGTERLLIRNVRVESAPKSCAKPPCPQNLSVFGELYNDGENPVSRATLGVGLVWLPSGQTLDSAKGVSPQSEARVEVTALALSPTQSKPFRLQIERDVPASRDGKYTPVVRVISYE